MFSNNLKIAFRTLKKNKIYTIINLLGLTVGIAAALLIFRMVTYELSFNKNFEGYENIVRIISKGQLKSGDEKSSVCTPLPAMDEMKTTVPQFTAVSRMHEHWGYLTIPNPNDDIPLKKFGMDDAETAFFTEPDFTKIFSFEWLAGEKLTALKEPNTIVLTKKWAEKCFDNWENAMGQTVLIDNQIPLIVKGVLADLPVNCDFNFPFLMSYPTLENNADLFFFGGGWGSCSSNDQVYAKLENNANRATVTAILAKIGETQYTNRSRIQAKKHVMQPLSDLHYNEDLSNSGTHRTSKTRLQLLGFIGILILAMACFNFINLATAQSTLRAKEVGVRKTLGSSRKELIGQFMSETGILVGVSVVLGINLAVFCMPLMSHVSDVPESLPFLANPQIWGFLALITVLLTLLAGLYPALRLSSYQPVKALNNNISQEKYGGASVRKSLVVLQFAVAQALIIGTMVTLLQMDYIQSADLGFKQDLVYNFGFNNDSTTVSRLTALKQNLLQIPTVEQVSFNSDLPMSGNTWRSNWRYGTHAEDEPFNISMKFCDENYMDTYGIELLAGRWLSPSDTMREAIVNKTALDRLDINNPEEAVGQTISMGNTKMKLVGVTEDFHTHSLRTPHEPTLLSTRKEYYWLAGVKIRPTDISTTTAAIQKVFDAVLPEQVFDGNFMDENIAGFYQDEARLAATCKGFGFLAILISCLGLFGLATHAATQRVKEIGIRKVLGASVSNIIGLLSKDFLKLVIVALALAVPTAWWFMDGWLDNFAYRIDLQWWVFVIAGLVAVAIAFLSVSYQSVRAALSNPVKSLRSE